MALGFDKDLAEILEVEEKASISKSCRFFVVGCNDDLDGDIAYHAEDNGGIADVEKLTVHCSPCPECPADTSPCQ